MERILSWILHELPLLVERWFYAVDEARKLAWYVFRHFVTGRLRFLLAGSFIAFCFWPWYHRVRNPEQAACRRAVYYPALPGSNRCAKSYVLYRLKANDSPSTVAALFNRRYKTGFTPEQMFLHEPALLYPGEDMAGRIFSLPVLDLGDDRRNSILRFQPALFILEERSGLDATAPFYELPVLSSVDEHNQLIIRFARFRGLDVNLVRAIIFMETTHGWYDSVTGVVVSPRTIRPMNVNIEYWQDKRWDRLRLEEPRYNIQAGTWILSEIQRRLYWPDAAKIGTLYNNLHAESISVYGKRVEYLFLNRPWQRKER